jgi:putative aminopeptidase FrvX
MEDLMQDYLKFITDKLVNLCNIPSPSGFTQKAATYLEQQFQELNLKTKLTRKGSVLADLGGKDKPVLLAAHIDTLGAMVRAIKSDGRLRLSKIGSYPENNIEAENCIVHTRTGQTYSATVQMVNPAVHVNSQLGKQKRDDKVVEVVLDEKVYSKKDVEKLEISAGDFISFDPRTLVTSSGFIKSRHLDDKASAAILMGLAKMVADGKLKLNRRVYLLFTTYEEVGHGGSAGIPQDVQEMISVDMGAVGDDLKTDETMVSICAKDSGGPYDFEVTNKLIALAKKYELNYAVDIYPFYGSDVEATLRAGYDIKHALIGPGVSASHGYERTHQEGLQNTLELLKFYLQQ